MTQRFWTKLFHDILFDPKMARMPAWKWRRTVEMFVLASMNGDDGSLPTLTDMAWILRSETTEKLAQELRAIAETGIVREVRPGHWLVVNFRKRQFAEGTERTRRYRERLSATRHSDVDSDAACDADDSNSNSTLLCSDSEEGGVGGTAPPPPEPPPLTPEQTAEITADANRTVDAVLATARRKSYANRDKIPEPYLVFADLYCELTGQEPTKRVISEWLLGFAEWEAEHLRPEHIREAFQIAMNPERGFSVARPAALTKTAVAVKTRMFAARGGAGPKSELDRALSVIGGSDAG